MVISVLERGNKDIKEKNQEKETSEKIGWGLLKNNFTERMNLENVCYHIIDLVKNAVRCLYFQQIPF